MALPYLESKRIAAKLLLILFFAFEYGYSLYAQNTPFIFKGGSPSDAIISPNGDLLFFGQFSDSLVINGHSEYINKGLKSKSWGYEDAFIMMYNSKNELKFKKQLWAIGKNSKPNGEVRPSKICEDRSGNIYITGFFNDDSLHFDNTAIYGQDSGKRNTIDFLIKLNSTGDILWYKTIKGSGQISSIAADENGLMIYGDAGFSITEFDSIKLSIDGLHVHNNALYIARYSSSGKALWVKPINGDAFDYAGDLSYTNNGNYFINGSFESSNLILGKDTLRKENGNPLFLALIDTGGNFKWARQSKGESYVAKTVTDKLGFVYLMGIFYGKEMKLDNIKIERKDTSDLYGNLFITKYNINGAPIWAQSYHVNFWPFDILLDNNDDIILGGNYHQDHVVMFDSIGIKNNGVMDIIIAKLTNMGDVISVISYGAEDSDGGNYLVKNPVSGNVYLGGFTKSQNLQIEKNTFTNKFNSINNFFTATKFAKLGVETLKYKTDIFLIYPNPATNIITIQSNQIFNNLQYTIIDQTGRLILKGKLNNETTFVDISSLESGLYFLKIGEAKNMTFKIVKR